MYDWTYRKCMCLDSIPRYIAPALNLCPSQYLYGTILMTPCSMVWDWRVLWAEPLLSCWSKEKVIFLIIFPLFYIFLPWVDCVGLGSSVWWSVIFSQPCTADSFLNNNNYNNNNNKTTRIRIWYTWNGFEKVKPAPRPGRRLLRCCKLRETFDEIADPGCCCFLPWWHCWHFRIDQKWVLEINFL